jgi:hypothetical protein
VATNLFYWNNLVHDLTYRYGFNDVAGNFQQNNYGRGGLGGDYVRAEAQDNANGTSRNNANFSTPPDGQLPRMQIYVWNQTTPQRDGDGVITMADHGIVVGSLGNVLPSPGARPALTQAGPVPLPTRAPGGLFGTNPIGGSASEDEPAGGDGARAVDLVLT